MILSITLILQFFNCKLILYLQLTFKFFYVKRDTRTKKPKKEGIDMNTASCEKAPSLSRDEAIAILDTRTKNLRH